MFEGFREDYIDGDGARIFIRRAGSKAAPPLLLLHGYPQTSAMWEKVAPALANKFQVICADLRGYGRSDKPPSDADHYAYSKRAMANDLVTVMTALGHQRFMVGAHDRGARVAHRMGLDHAHRISAMALLDIAPTREMYALASDAFAAAYWHWFFLIQPAPLPETLIGADPEAFWRLKCFAQAGLEDDEANRIFSKAALAEYLAAFNDPVAIHASCEDYRAAHTIDLVHDDEDGGKKLELPLLVLWGRHGVIEKCFDALSLWRARAVQVEGSALEAGHYLAEEIPDEIIERFEQFFEKHSGVDEAAS